MLILTNGRASESGGHGKDELEWRDDRCCDSPYDVA